MTCVWDGLIKKLKLKSTPASLMTKMQLSNKITENVMVNGVELTDKQKEENYQWIKNLSHKSINKGTGYNCSTCDPLLILVAELYNVTIVHQYCSYKIVYTNRLAKRVIHVKSDMGHFE